MKNFKLIMKSLVNNDACIEGGRTKKWYFALIFVVLALILAVLPITVSTIKTNGSDFTNLTYLYNYDNAIVAFSDHLYENELHMVVQGEAKEKYLEVDQDVWNALHPQQKYIHRNLEDEIDFEVYYSSKVGDEFNEFYLNVSKYANPYEPSEDSPRYASYLLFGKEMFAGQLFKPSEENAISGIAGDYKTLEVGFDFSDVAKITIDGVIYETSQDEKFINNPLHLNSYRSSILSSWNRIYDNLYYNSKLRAIRDSTLIMLGVDILLVFFMGLMVFILTRGKNNPFRIYTFWETQKIAYWAALAPGLLAMILGFILPQYAVMIFVMLVGIRIMWMSMKSLKPAQ
ncbi:MAG: hypothetical protein GX132_02605 [Erysipelotrichia bacterium]|nr:hypothetical protein [Erysipelotrichia bacterium]